MNIIFISPHFPSNYYQFSQALANQGVKVLGIADCSYDHLDWELKKTLTEYYRVDNMEDYGQLKNAVNFFHHKYGPIDRIFSLNEHWLEKEANLRSDFNIPGIKKDTIDQIKQKSQMKQLYQSGGIAVARGEVIRAWKDAEKLVKAVGFPLVAKPDKGVGAANTFKINNVHELKHFFDNPPQVDYIFEEYISGELLSFDGLVGQNGELLFYTSHCFSDGIMETVNNDQDMYYYSLREIPPDLEKEGRKALQVFQLKESFFHFEFFRTHKDKKIVALEVNMRPPGGLTTDMMNYANDVDVYQEWANILTQNKFKAKYSRPYFCAYIGRKFNKNYVYGHEQILSQWPGKISHHTIISGVFSPALGNYGYIARSPDLKEIKSIINYIHQKQ